MKKFKVKLTDIDVACTTVEAENSVEAIEIADSMRDNLCFETKGQRYDVEEVT